MVLHCKFKKSISLILELKWEFISTKFDEVRSSLSGILKTDTSDSVFVGIDEKVTVRAFLMHSGTKDLFVLVTIIAVSQNKRFRYHTLRHSHAAPPPERVD